MYCVLEKWAANSYLKNTTLIQVVDHRNNILQQSVNEKQFFMTKEAIFLKVTEVLSKILRIEPSQIRLSSTFEDLGMDSLDGLELINDLEKTYNVILSNEDVLKIKSVQQAVESLHQMVVTAGQTEPT
jgi:acyl carrier protein